MWSKEFRAHYAQITDEDKYIAINLRKKFIAQTISQNPVFDSINYHDLDPFELFLTRNICPYEPSEIPQYGEEVKPPITLNLSKTPQENEMTPNSSVAVQSITYVFGVPEDQVSDAQIFERIASIELTMAELGKIKAKSSKISEKIASYKADIAALVAIVDAR